jgi:hypothetical protein
MLDFYFLNYFDLVSGLATTEHIARRVPHNDYA